MCTFVCLQHLGKCLQRPKRALELQLQAVVSGQARVQGTELGSSRRVIRVLQPLSHPQAMLMFNWTIVAFAPCHVSLTLVEEALT